MSHKSKKNLVGNHQKSVFIVHLRFVSFGIMGGLHFLFSEWEGRGGGMVIVYVVTCDYNVTEGYLVATQADFLSPHPVFPFTCWPSASHTQRGHWEPDTLK